MSFRGCCPVLLVNSEYSFRGVKSGVENHRGAPERRKGVQGSGDRQSPSMRTRRACGALRSVGG